MSEITGRQRRVLVGVAILLAVAAAVWLPTWWEKRLYRQQEAIVGVGASVLSGSAGQARRRIENGMSSEKVTGAIGRPSIALHTDGSSTHDIWTYYYSDGTMTVNLTDGVIQRIALDMNAPKIPTSRRR